MNLKNIDFSRVGRFISLHKIKFVRGYSYVSAFSIPFLVAKAVSDMMPNIPWWTLFALAVIIVWIIGEIDFRGLWKYELEYSFTKNPEWMKKTGGKTNEE